MDSLRRAITATACTTHVPGNLGFVLLAAVVAAPILATVAWAQTCRLNASWPGFDYDGKPAQTDDSYSKATEAGSRIETARYVAESRTMTAADGRLQVRLDGKNYKGFPAEEYAVSLTNLSKTEPTAIVANFRSLRISLDKLEADKPIVLNVLRGSTCTATDFIPDRVHSPNRTPL